MFSLQYGPSLSPLHRVKEKYLLENCEVVIVLRLAISHSYNTRSVRFPNCSDVTIHHFHVITSKMSC